VMVDDSKCVEGYDKDNPFLAKITERYLLNAPGGDKETIHCVIDLSGSGLQYEAGDSIGIYCENDPVIVRQILDALGFTGKEPVMLPKMDEPIDIFTALLDKLSLAQPTRKFMEFLKEKEGSLIEREQIRELLLPENKEQLKTYLEEREYVDLLEEYPSLKVTPQELVDHMRRLVPRMYSIASSPHCYPNEVHLTVAVLRYKTNQRDREGVATCYLADRKALNSPSLPIFLSKSHHFRLPEDDSVDVIMVGPGTGIAPFRAFMQERSYKKASGRNWLFFGERTSQYDYLYSADWGKYLEEGTLNRLDLAFSRDQAHKIYVQDRMLESAPELWQWLNKGAYFYVCGDAKRMAKDVDAALHKICEREGNLSEDEAKAYIRELKKEKRYVKDVY